MSSSYRRAGLCALAGALGMSSAAWSQQVYFIPRVETSAQWNTNREMISTPGLQDQSTSYQAIIEGTWGRRTQRSDTALRPRIRMQQFPDRRGVDPVEGFLDLRHNYRTLKGDFSLLGRYRRQDTINAEYGTANFDDFDPTHPQPQDTGIVLVGGTRTTAQVQPQFSYSLTERNRIDAFLGYESVKYDNKSSLAKTRVGYKSPSAGFNFARLLRPRTQLTAGPYFARYEADDNSNDTNSYGVAAGLRQQWSEISYVELTARGERDDITELLPARVEKSTTNWGVELMGFRRNRVGSLRYGIGRLLQPSTLGSRAATDQVHLEYVRPFSPRLSFNGAVRLQRSKRIDATGTTSNEDRIWSDLALRWQLTQTWYVSGAYRYTRQELGTTSRNADDHGIIISIGFRGREPER